MPPETQFFRLYSHTFLLSIHSSSISAHSSLKTQLTQVPAHPPATRSFDPSPHSIVYSVSASHTLCCVADVQRTVSCKVSLRNQMAVHHFRHRTQRLLNFTVLEAIMIPCLDCCNSLVNWSIPSFLLPSVISIAARRILFKYLLDLALFSSSRSCNHL